MQIIHVLRHDRELGYMPRQGRKGRKGEMILLK